MNSLPALITFVGAMISAIGRFWAILEQGAGNKKDTYSILGVV